MEKTRFLKIVIIFLLVLNTGTLLFLFIGKGPGGNRQRGHGNHEGPGKFIIEELKLDENQQAQFDDLKKEHQGQMRILQDSMRIQREMLPDIIISGDNSKADSAATIIGRCQKQIEIYTYQHFVKVYNICNADQRKKFKTIIGDILKMMGPRKGGPPHRD